MKRYSHLEKRTAFDYINYFLLTVITFFCIVPVLHTLAASFSSPAELAQHEGLIWHPMGFTLEGYKLVLKNRAIGTGYLNTLFYVVTATALNILMTSLGAYVCSRKKALFSRAITFLITFTMFFSGGLIPFYLTVNKLGLTNTRLSQILPVAISAWNLIIMRTSMVDMPDSIEESAQMDGANDFIILFRIILPLIKPVLAVMVLFYAVGHWNSWFNAMVFLRIGICILFSCCCGKFCCRMIRRRLCKWQTPIMRGMFIKFWSSIAQRLWRQPRSCVFIPSCRNIL